MPNIVIYHKKATSNNTDIYIIKAGLTEWEN